MTIAPGGRRPGSRAVEPFIKLSSRETRQFWEIPVLYEDDCLLALDKPARLLAVPDPGQPDQPSLLGLLRRDIARGAPWARERRIVSLAAAHRLDGEASGVLLLARTRQTLLRMAHQWGAGKPIQRCAAIVHGAPAEERFRIEARLARHPVHPGHVRVDPRRGKPAQTDFAVVERFQNFALLDCFPLTHQPHQIQAHLRSAGLRLVADAWYGGPPVCLSQLKRDYRPKADQEERPLMGRAALHAIELAIDHPVTSQPIAIASPWPKDFTVTLKYLRRFAQAA